MKGKSNFLFLIYLGFLSLGLPVGLMNTNYSLIRAEFGWEIEGVAFILGALFLGRMVITPFSGPLSQKIGENNLNIFGICMNLFGSVLYIWTPVNWVIFVAAFFNGIGDDC